jgi:hypothetical protein
MMRSRRLLAAILIGSLTLLTACQSGGASKVVNLQARNDSGVTGTVTVVDLGNSRSRVEIKVDPAGKLDMPAHVHPGTCANLIPQPKYPLTNVQNGVSTTVVPASFAELTGGNLTVTLHQSNTEMKVTTACGDLAS